MSAHGDDQSWVARALCASTEPDALFVQGASQRQIRLRCYECEVRIECLADALQSEANYGVWGGLTERERRAILRRIGWSGCVPRMTRLPGSCAVRMCLGFCPTFAPRWQVG